MTRNIATGRNRSGFSLVELVVVVLIMGILAAVAAPRMFDKMNEARENSTRQSLGVIRGAIEVYKVENDTYPAAASSLATDLAPFMKGEFPKVEVIDGGDNSVGASTVSPVVADSNITGSWLYNKDTGEIRINDSAYQGW